MKVSGRAVLKVLDFQWLFFPWVFSNGDLPLRKTNIHVYLFVSVCTYLHRNGKTDMKRIVTIVQRVPR